MMLVRRRFLTRIGATLALPAISRLCNAQAPQNAPKLTELLKADLQGQGQTVQETLANLLEMAPGVSAPWHMHPGAQEIVFVIEGSLVVEVEGQGAKQIPAGGISLIPAETPHLVRNGNLQRTASALVVHSRSDKQKPFLVVLKRAI
jgi:quercetin dioxygenase-like cupin family protein